MASLSNERKAEMIRTARKGRPAPRSPMQPLPLSQLMVLTLATAVRLRRMDRDVTVPPGRLPTITPPG